VWFAGYTPQLATAVAVADLDGRQTTLDGRTYNGERISSACGGCIPGPIWKEAMDTALEGARMLAFHKPDPSVVRGLNEPPERPDGGDDEENGGGQGGGRPGGGRPGGGPPDATPAPET
jgi:membrane peptidoglycan carboxypeptidase